MHEAGIAERILEAALAAAEDAHAVHLTGVEVEAGPGAPMSQEALRFHWADATSGTAVEGAVLRIVPVDEPGVLRLVAIEIDERRPERRPPAAGPLATRRAGRHPGWDGPRLSGRPPRPPAPRT